MGHRAIFRLALSALAACAPADQRPLPESQAAAVASSPAVSTAHTDWDRTLGVVVSRRDTLCLRIRRADIPVGMRVLLVSTDTTHQSTTAMVSGRLASGCGLEIADQDERAYRLAASSAAPGVLWVGVVDSAGTYALTPPFDIDRDGKPEQFRECASLEGVHFTVWTGAPPAGVRRWHYYYYFGYDVDPTCSDAETSE